MSSESPSEDRLPEPVNKLERATNAHDVDGIVAGFAGDYVNRTPAHPDRGFTGSDRVRGNWTAILAAVPDFVAEVTDWASRGDTVWTEWLMRGRRGDGSPHEMYGTIIFTMRGDEIAAARFHLEPVESGGPDVDGAVRRRLSAAS